MPDVQRRQREQDHRGSLNEEEGVEEGEDLGEDSWENVKEMLPSPVDLSQRAQSRLTSLEEGPAVEVSFQSALQVLSEVVVHLVQVVAVQVDPAG